MIRRYLIWQHRWTGLLMTVFLIVVGLTGSMLAYKFELERLINPQFFATPRPGAKPLDLATLAERAEAEEPHARVGYFSYVPARSGADQVVIECGPRIDPATGKPYQLDFDHLFLDPWTGKELGRRHDFDTSRVNRLNLMPFIYRLHTSLALGNAGALVLGYVALVWTLDCFIGFYLTLPASKGPFWRRWKKAWWVKWRANAFRINFDLHRAGGLWVWPLLFIFAWSSVMFNLNPVYEKVTRTVFDYRSDMEFILAFHGRAIERPKLDWRAAQARGEQLLAQQAVIHGFTIRQPFGLAYLAKQGVYSYDAITSRDFRPHGWGTGVWLDGDTGELKHLWLPDGEHAGNTIGNWLWAFHFADVYGLRSYRFLVAVIGLLISMLSVTGVYIWWKKQLLRRQRTAQTFRHRTERCAGTIARR